MRTYIHPAGCSRRSKTKTCWVSKAQLDQNQMVMVKDFSWNIIPCNALFYEKTLKQYQFSTSRITDLF